jgi:hypothetical protein
LIKKACYVVYISESVMLSRHKLLFYQPDARWGAEGVALVLGREYWMIYRVPGFLAVV